MHYDITAEKNHRKEMCDFCGHVHARLEDCVQTQVTISIRGRRFIKDYDKQQLYEA